MFFLEHGHCAVTEPASKKSSFVSALKCVLVYFAVAFFVLSGTTHAQQTVTCSTHRPSDPPTDKDALIALYCATDGDNWTNSGNWLTDMPLGNWHGVTLDRLGGVQYLHLQENELSGTIPPQLGNLTNLLQLYLWSNNLEGSIPSELGNLSELVVLYLDKNELTGTIPTELGKLPNLRNNLGLSQNQLEGSIPSELGNLTELQVLDLRDNKLTGSIPPELEKLGSTSRYGGMKELFLSQTEA